MSSARLAAEAGRSSSCLEARFQPERVQNAAANLQKAAKPESLGPVCTISSQNRMEPIPLDHGHSGVAMASARSL